MAKPSVPESVYQQCFELSPWPGLLINRDNQQIVASNQAWQSLVPLTTHGQSVSQFLELELSELDLSDLTLLAQNIQGTLFPQKQRVPCSLFLCPLEDFIWLQVQIDTQTRQEIQQEQSLSTRKSELIANISHELRTPLTAILGWPEILLDAQDMPGLAIQAAQAIRRDGIFLRQLLEDLIDLSKIEAGHTEIHLQTRDLRQILQHTVEMLRDQAQWKQQSLSLSLADHPTWVNVDQTRMTQVFLNYLSNAIKYTPEGGQIEIYLGTQGQEVLVEIRDNGMGMQESIQKRVFERYTRAKDVEALDGSGIGLSLVKKLVELHHGKCWVRSEYKKGSQFYLALPLIEYSLTGGHDNSEEPDDYHQLKSYTLGILAEDTNEREMLQKLFTPFLSAVYSFSIPPEREALRQLKIDLMIASVSLESQLYPDWITQQVGAIPVIALSNSAMKGDADRLKQAGYQAISFKPFLKTDLLQCMQSLLIGTQDV